MSPDGPVIEPVNWDHVKTLPKVLVSLVTGDLESLANQEWPVDALTASWVGASN